MVQASLLAHAVRGRTLERNGGARHRSRRSSKCNRRRCQITPSFRIGGGIRLPFSREPSLASEEVECGQSRRVVRHIALKDPDTTVDYDWDESGIASEDAFDGAAMALSETANKANKHLISQQSEQQAEWCTHIDIDSGRAAQSQNLGEAHSEDALACWEAARQVEVERLAQVPVPVTPKKSRKLSSVFNENTASTCVSDSRPQYSSDSSEHGRTIVDADEYCSLSIDKADAYWEDMASLHVHSIKTLQEEGTQKHCDLDDLGSERSTCSTGFSDLDLGQITREEEFRTPMQPIRTFKVDSHVESSHQGPLHITTSRPQASNEACSVM